MPNRFLIKTANEDASKTPFFKRRSTRIGLGITAGAGAGLLLGSVVGRSVERGLDRANIGHLGREAVRTKASRDRLEDLATRLWEHQASIPKPSIRNMSHDAFMSTHANISARAGRAKSVSDAASDAWSTSFAADNAHKIRNITAGFRTQMAIAAAGGAAGGTYVARKKRSEKTASVEVPAQTGVAIFPRDLTQFMSENDADLVKRRAPHRRYDPGVLARAVTRGAIAYGARVRSRMRSENEPLGHAARYAAEDAGLGLRDFFLEPALTPADAAGAFSKMSPVTAALGTGANEALRRTLRSTYGRDQAAKRSVQAVTAARFWEGAASGQPLRALLSDGRRTRRNALAEARRTPAGDPVRLTL